MTIFIIKICGTLGRHKSHTRSQWKILIILCFGTFGLAQDSFLGTVTHILFHCNLWNCWIRLSLAPKKCVVWKLQKNFIGHFMTQLLRYVFGIFINHYNKWVQYVSLNVKMYGNHVRFLFKYKICLASIQHWSFLDKAHIFIPNKPMIYHIYMYICIERPNDNESQQARGWMKIRSSPKWHQMM